MSAVKVTSTRVAATPRWRATRPHRRGHVGGAGAGREQHLADPEAEVQGQVELARRHTGMVASRRVTAFLLVDWSAVRIDFTAPPSPTLGVEWEFALVDRRTRDLSNTAADLFAAGHAAECPTPSGCTRSCCATPSRWSPGSARTVAEAMDDLRETLGVVVPAADELGVDLLRRRARTRSRPGRRSS